MTLTEAKVVSLHTEVLLLMLTERQVTSAQSVNIKTQITDGRREILI
jgi:hypothetical protein